MTDLERDLRELFESKAADASFSARPRQEALRRARRRQAGTIVTATFVAAALVGSAFVAGQALFDAGAPRPAIEPSPTSGPLPVSARDGIAFVRGSAIYTVQPDGTDEELVLECQSASCAGISDPAWSPDGRMIAFEREDADRTSDIWIVNADGTGPSMLLDCDGRSSGPLAARRPCLDEDPAWSPDGTQITFTRNGSLYIVNADGSGLRSLATGLSGVADPVWSPDGTRIAFSMVGERDRLYVMSPDGSNLVQLYDAPSGSGPFAPAWSPDAARIAYFVTPRRDAGFVGEVWVMEADGSGSTRIFESACCVQDWGGPAWSPNGGQIAFVLGIGDPPQLMLVNADGTHIRTLGEARGEISWR
jgi:TolB protein